MKTVEDIYLSLTNKVGHPSAFATPKDVFIEKGFV